MANKKLNQLVSKPSLTSGDLFPIADATTGQLFKTTISALGTAIGSGVSSVNTLVGAVVLDTDDIQELASPINKYFTDLRARAAISAGTGISYNSGTGVITNAVTSGQISTALGYTPADDSLVVKLAGSQTITGTKTFQQAPLVDIGVGFKNSNGVYNTMQSLVTGWQMPVNGNNHNLIFSTTTNYVYTFPNASGTIALTSDLTPYALDNTVVKLTGTQTVAGIKTMSNVLKLDDTLQIKNIAQLSNNTGYTGVWAETAAIGFYTGANAIRLLYAGNYNYTMPSSDGTLALVSQLSAYLPLAGGTLTGALNGTSALFSGAVRANNPAEGATGEGLIAGQSFKIDGTGTSQKAVMYLVSNVLSDTYASGLTAQFANFAGDKGFGFNLNTSGGYEVYVKNSTWNKALTIANTGAATFSSSVTATQGNFFQTAISGFAINLRNRNANQTWGLVVDTDAVDDKNLGFYSTQGAVYALKLASTGAATFSGSVKSNTLFSVGTGSGKFFGVGSDISGSFASTDLIAYNTGGDLYLLSTGAVGVIVKASTGSVGIGTTNPTSVLHIGTSTSGNQKIQQWGEPGFVQDYGLILRGSSLDGVFKFYGLNNGTETTNPILSMNRSNGNVGIGTTAPFSQGSGATTMELAGSVYGQFFVSANSASIRGVMMARASTLNDVYIATITNSPLLFGTNDSEKMRITSGGVVLVNQTTLSAAGAGNKMQVATDFLATGALAGLFFENRTGGVTINSNWYGWYATGGTIFLFNGAANISSINSSTGVYTPLSDRNKKKDFEVSNIGLNEVMKLKPTLYRMKSDSSEGLKELGFIAQDVKSVIPNAYVESKEFIGLNYNPIVAALTKAVQELKQKIDILENK
jgi:hypothetical protein